MPDIDWTKLNAECVDFAQRLIQTPSMPGNEGPISALVAKEMRANNFDEVWQDDIGNVYGRMYGRDRRLGTLILNSHLDHVDPGDPSLWPVPPYSGTIQNGYILGRGACDIKGPLAVQVYSMIALARIGFRPKRDVVFCGVVEEEVGGAGAIYWRDQLDYPVDLIVLGEPSDNKLSLGHRGLLQVWVKFQGKSVHSSVPDTGRNPNFALAEFITALKSSSTQLSEHLILGPTTVAPTVIEVDTESVNVTPAWSRVLLDFRTASESTNGLLDFVQNLAGDWPIQLSNALSPNADEPFQDSDELIYGFYTSPDDPAVEKVSKAILRGTGATPELSYYRFATDGRHFVPLGVPIIGYSAGEDHYAHRVDERISIPKMLESLQGHVSILGSY